MSSLGYMDFKASVSDPYAVDLGNRAAQGKIVSKTIKLGMFTVNRNAVWAARNQLRKESYPFGIMSFVVNRDMFRLEVGDCFKLSYNKYSISEMICRVLLIEEKNLESEKITIHAMQDIFSATNVITEYSDPWRGGDPPGYSLLPFVNQRVDEALYVHSEDIAVMPLACRTGLMDLGFEIYMSIDDGSSYFLLNRVSNLCPYGTLVDAYPVTYTIDDETGFEIEFVADASLVETVTWPEIFSAGKNIALLGNEVISFQAITPVSGNKYKLEGIIRGRFGTQKVAHAADETFYAVHKNSMFLKHAEILAGASRKFKFVPYNIKKKLDISEATALDLDVEGEAKKPYTPINFLANGSSFAARYSADIVLTWSPRYRGQGAGIGIPGEVLANADREGYFEIEVWVSGSKVRTATAVDAATWTYTEVMNNTDNGALASEVLFKLSNYRSEDGVTYESDQVEVTCKKN